MGKLSTDVRPIDLNALFPWFQFSEPIQLDTDLPNLVNEMDAQLKDEMKYNLTYNLYYAFGKFRQLQSRYQDYLQNILKAYIYGNICDKIKILKEINVLKQHIFRNTALDKNTIMYLTHSGLIQRWKENTLLEGVHVCYCPNQY